MGPVNRKLSHKRGAHLQRKLRVGRGLGGRGFGSIGMRRSGLGNFIEGVGGGQDQVADTFASGSGNRMEWQSAFSAKGAEFIEMRMVGSSVELGGYDDHRLFAKRGAEGDQFAVDDFE